MAEESTPTRASETGARRRTTTPRGASPRPGSRHPLSSSAFRSCYPIEPSVYPGHIQYNAASEVLFCSRYLAENARWRWSRVSFAIRHLPATCDGRSSIFPALLFTKGATCSQNSSSKTSSSLPFSSAGETPDVPGGILTTLSTNLSVDRGRKLGEILSSRYHSSSTDKKNLPEEEEEVDLNLDANSIFSRSSHLSSLLPP